MPDQALGGKGLGDGYASVGMIHIHIWLLPNDLKVSDLERGQFCKLMRSDDIEPIVSVVVN